MDSAQNPPPQHLFPKAIEELAAEYPPEELVAAYKAHREELEACPSEQACYKKLAAYLEAAHPPVANPPALARIAQGDAAALRELNAMATPRPLPERERKDRECTPCTPRREEPWEKQKRRTLPPSMRTPERGRGETPWELFREAGFSPVLLTEPERSLLRTVYRVHTVGQGWHPRDKTSRTLPGIPLEPSRLARYLGTTPRTVTRSIRRLIACGLLCVVERTPGYAPLYASGWWHGREAQEENLVALRRSLELFRTLRPSCRPPRKGGRGKPRRKAVDNAPSVPPSVGGSVGGSVPPSVGGSVGGGGGTDETGNPLETQGDTETKKHTPKRNLRILESEKERISETDRMATPSPTDEEEEAPKGGGSETPGMPAEMDWEELRKLACSKLTTHPGGEKSLQARQE